MSGPDTDRAIFERIDDTISRTSAAVAEMAEAMHDVDVALHALDDRTKRMAERLDRHGLLIAVVYTLVVAAFVLGANS